MEDPKRCCFRAVTSASFGPLTLRSVPLPELCDARCGRDPLPDALPPPPLPDSPASASQPSTPAWAIKTFCSALIASCSFAGAPAHVPPSLSVR